MAYQYGTSPRKLQPQVKTKTSTKKKQNKKVNKKLAGASKINWHIIAPLVLVGMFLVCLRTSQINQKFKEIQSVKKEYLALQTTNDQLEIGIQSELDLTNIERYAKDKLGMQKADGNQIKYVDIAKEDKVELSEKIEQKTNIFQDFLDNIAKILK